MKKQFTLNRNGTFTPKTDVSNQCRVRGHYLYEYLVRITCSTKLDTHDFIIDHMLIDRAVQKATKNAASCERFCLEIVKEVKQTLKRNDIKPLKLYIRIRPRAEQSLNFAFMEYEEG